MGFMSRQSSTHGLIAGWSATPVGALCRADLKRIWNGHTIRSACWALAALVVIQLIVGVVIEQQMPLRSRTGWRWFLYISSALGLNPGWTAALFSSLGMLRPGHFISGGGIPLWMMMLLDLATVPIQMLSPAFAAASIAPDREKGRLEELLLAGFSPRQILLAKGLAALAPFLVLSLVLRMVNLGARAFWISPSTQLPVIPVPGAPWLMTGLSIASTVGLLARWALLVMVSALCRRYRTALPVCYTVAFCLPVLTQAVSLAPGFQNVGTPFLRTMGLSLGSIAATMIAAVLLAPRALEAVAAPHGEQKPRARRMRIMDYGQEEGAEGGPV